MNQEWFEMKGVRRRDFNKSSWVPLRASLCSEQQGKRGREGFRESFFGAGSVAIPLAMVDKGKALNWMDIGLSRQHFSYFQNDVYRQADLISDDDPFAGGIHLVLDQLIEDGNPDVWHLHQDLVIALGLRREGNLWVRPSEGYVEVARLSQDDGGRATLLEIKAEFLKDYLCARNMALVISEYHNREAVVADASTLKFENNSSHNDESTGRWEGRVEAIHEGGAAFGSKIAYIHASRTDVHFEDDVPEMDGIPTDENTTGHSWEGSYSGKRVFRVNGEFWRTQIVLPGSLSTRIRGDKSPTEVYFVIGADGAKASGTELAKEQRWLWFRPEVIMSLAHRRGGSLEFHTAQTGSVACAYGYNVHFGINDLGLVNVYAKDIGRLPEWQQQAWCACNVSPEGGVSQELLSSQVNAVPANTVSPESFFPRVFDDIDRVAETELSIKLFREHSTVDELVERTHRFRAVDDASLLALAKDLARLTADRLDAEAMQSIVAPPKKKKWGSLKSLENLLAAKFDRQRVRDITAPLVGVYELRHGDAHLPGSQLDEAFGLVKIDRSLPLVHQAHEMISCVVSSLYEVMTLISKYNSGQEPDSGS